MAEQDAGFMSGNDDPSVRAAEELREMLGAVAREIASLDMLRRTLLSGVIRQRSGMSVDDWLQAAGSLAVLMQSLGPSGQGGDGDGRRRRISMLAEWGGKLERLAGCFHMAAQEAGRFVSDPGELAGSLQALAHREQVVRRLIAEIDRLGSA